MKEPLRLLNDPEWPAALRDALVASQAAPPALPPAVHAALSGVAAQLGAATIAASTTGIGVATGVGAATGGGAATGAGTGVAAASGVGGGISAAMKLIAVVTCLGGAGTVAYVAEPLFVPASSARRPSTADSATAATSGAARPMKAHVKPSSASSSGADAQYGDPVSAVVPLVEPAVAQSPVEPATVDLSARRNQEPAKDVGGIAAEARLLERARRHMSSDPALSLRETDQHRERFASGKMMEERELIAVEALLRLGRRSEAERRAAQQLQQNGAGLYTKRLQQLLDEF